nr:MAG TPA: hypothetical protein [Caudoviricetes sp.]
MPHLRVHQLQTLIELQTQFHLQYPKVIALQLLHQ